MERETVSMTEREKFRKLGREGFKVTRTDREFDAMYDEVLVNIEAYRIAHPIAWAEAEERERGLL